MERIFWLGLFYIALVTACATSWTATEQPGTPAAAGPGVEEIAKSGPGSMLDSLERDMQQALASSPDAVILDRQGDLLTVALQDDGTFAAGSATPQPVLYPLITKVAQVLDRYPKASIRVEGHSDSAGKEEDNLALSVRRAESVRNLLFRFGVSPRWIEVAGLGETRPLTADDKEASRRKNQCVGIKISLPPQ